jgi:predicted DsbA family dithiol-disulfide isomerase
MMKVEVYRDFACAWSRLSVRRFDRAVEMVGGDDIELVHRPYQLNPALEPDAAPRPLLDVMAGIFGSREQAESMLGNMARLGAGEGADFQVDRALAVSTLPRTG